jgi:hypothetical protein
MENESRAGSRARRGPETVRAACVIDRRTTRALSIAGIGCASLTLTLACGSGNDPAALVGSTGSSDAGSTSADSGTGSGASSSGAGGSTGSGGNGGIGGTAPDTSCGNGTMLEVPSAHATIEDALAAAADGDTILVDPGSYSIGTLTIDKKNITLASRFCQSNDPADIETVELTGQVIFQGGSADGGRLLGLTILEPDGKDTVQPQASGTQILFNRIIAANDVIALDGQEGPVLIYGNYIKSDGGDDNIDIDGEFDVTIERNVLDTAAQDGIEMRFHSGIRQLQTVIIRDNVIMDSDEDAIQLMDGYGVDPGLRKIRIERNLLLRAGTAGVGMNDQSDSTQSYLGKPIEEEIVILNNSFVDCGAGISGGANALVGNNIFTGIQTRALWRVVGSSRVEKNLFFDNVQDHEETTAELSDNLMGQDPLLESDFTLGAGSPAIDAGLASFPWQSQTVAVTAGFALGGAPDLGAHEKE